MTTLISSIYSGFDAIKPLPDGHGFDDALLVTDHVVDAPGWRVLVEPRDCGPRLAAKQAKCCPWLYVDDPDVLWLDGSFEVLPGLRRVVDEHLALGDLVAWKHPSGRSDAYQEAEFSLRVPQYASEPLGPQTASYARAGYPAGSGLWEVGMLARRRTALTESHGAQWLAQVERWSIQDQVSFPFVCWALGVRPVEWAAASWASCGWVRWHLHQGESWWAP